MTSRKSGIALAALFSTILCGGDVWAADAIPDYAAKAASDIGRPWYELPFDAALHPAETMAFSGIKPGQAIAEVMPDTGYYTRMISKIARPKGSVYAMVPRGETPATKTAGQNIPLTRIQHAYAIMDISEYNNVTVIWQDMTEFGLPEQLDAVFSAFDYHALKSKEFAKQDTGVVNKAIFRAMKNGGVYTVMDHASAPGAGFTVADTLHRTDPEAVKAEVIAAGFVLNGESKVAAQASDDHRSIADEETPGKVFDDFLFRFKKPENAANTDMRPPPGSMDGYYGNTVVMNVGAGGNANGQRERRHVYHPDGTYQEFGAPGSGNNPMQSGLWYWDAAGHNCMLHEFPTDQRQFSACRDIAPFKKVGEHWKERNNTVPMTMLPGYEFFDKPAQ